jgi:ribosomal protein S19E (S16A)
MSDRGTPAAESKSNPKWPAPYMYTGEGKDRDPQQINIWFQAIANYMNSYGIKETNLDAV